MSTDLKVCPKCGQETASQFFRKVGRKELCVLCAQRSEEADKSMRETIEDRTLHGGYKWLWKHIVFVIAAVIAYFLFRGMIGSLIRAIAGGE